MGRGDRFPGLSKYYKAIEITIKVTSYFWVFFNIYNSQRNISKIMELGTLSFKLLLYAYGKYHLVQG